jgi:flagellar biosynthetic protein FliO
VAIRTPTRSRICTLLVVAAASCPYAAAGLPARGQEGKPAANTGGSITVNEAAVEPAARSDAVSSWMHQTLARPKDPLRPARAQADGSSLTRKNASLGHDARTGTLELLWPLLLVLGVIAGAAFVIRKVLPRGNRLGGGGVIDVLASHYLSSKQSLCLVRLGRRAVLLGVTPERITPVAEILQPEELAEIVSAIERKRPTSFTSTFARLCARDPGKRIGEEPVERQELASNEKLTHAGESVRDLVGRIRELSGTKASAEPT